MAIAPKASAYAAMYRPTTKNVPKKKTTTLGPKPPFSQGYLSSAGAPAGLLTQGIGAQAQPATAPAVTAPPAGPAGGRWNVPDYKAIIGGDWELGQAEAEGNQARGAAEAAFQQNLRQAFIDYGGDAAKLGDFSKYIDAPTIEAAKQNKFSQVAQNLAAMTKGLRRQRASLAARGILSSGQTTADTTVALQAREGADVEAQREFLRGASQGMGGLAETRQSIADRVAAARGSAAQRASEQYPVTYQEDAAPAAPPPAAASPWGGVSWGGRSGITTRAGMVQALRGQSYADWARKHPAAAARLR